MVAPGPVPFGRAAHLRTDPACADRPERREPRRAPSLARRRRDRRRPSGLSAARRRATRTRAGPQAEQHEPDRAGDRDRRVRASRPSVRPYVSSTCVDVGTTTIRFGASRYGPFAPVTFQFGKYDSFTSTGLPISETSKEILSTVELHVGDLGRRRPTRLRVREVARLHALPVPRAGLRVRGAELGAVHPPRRGRALPPVLHLRLGTGRRVPGWPQHFEYFGRRRQRREHDGLVVEPDDEVAVRRPGRPSSPSTLVGRGPAIGGFCGMSFTSVSSGWRPRASASPASTPCSSGRRASAGAARRGRSRSECRTRARAPGSTGAASTRRR